MSLQFLRTSHKLPSLGTMWFYLQIAIVLALCATSLVLMFTGKEAMGFAMGALALSLCTCSYAAMMHERVVMIYDQIKRIKL